MLQQMASLLCLQLYHQAGSEKKEHNILLCNVFKRTLHTCKSYDTCKSKESGNLRSTHAAISYEMTFNSYFSHQPVNSITKLEINQLDNFLD